MCPVPYHYGECKGPEARGLCVHGLASRVWEHGLAHSWLRCTQALSPITGCAEGRSAGPVLTQQRVHLSQHCWLTLPDPGLVCPPTPLPPSGPALHPPQGAGVLGSPKGGVLLARPRKALLDMRTVLCSVLLSLYQALQCTSVPSQQGDGCSFLAQGTPELEQSHWLGFH